MKSSNKKINPTFDETYLKSEEFFGHPYQELQEYFINQSIKSTLLDVGSGQGRDSLFLAANGFKVTAIDSSKVGISQMLNKAKEKGLKIKGIVVDVLKVQLNEKFNIILFDMLLHTFEKNQQIYLLEKFSKNLEVNGLFCIVFPNDLKSSYFMNLLNSLHIKWRLRDEIIIKDVPKIPNSSENNDFKFKMVVAQLLS